MNDKLNLQDPSPFWITRALLLRGLGVIYFFAFLSLVQQVIPLLGENGLLPIRLYLLEARIPSEGFRQSPSLFWFWLSDDLLLSLAWVGLALSVTVLLGWATSITLFLLWVIYLSYVDVGQIFFGYGWETLLLEFGFACIFLAPAFRPGEFSAKNPPHRLMLWLMYWLLFRLMFGSGLIKIRGDECWRDFRCLRYFYETQPLPNPASWAFHLLPNHVLNGFVLGNHFIELIVPWFLFLGRRFRRVGGVCIIFFQTVVFASGNFSWLNSIAIVIAIACFDDHTLSLLVSKRWKERLLNRPEVKSSGPRRFFVAAYFAVVVLLSIAPTANLFTNRQLMNASFDPLHLVNTYGAFGTVSRDRYEIILQGTNAKVLDEQTQWKEYEFKCKPGSVSRRPCIVAPYQYRIDWQMWFAAMSTIEREPWLVNLVFKLLHGDEAAISLLDGNPFPIVPPTYIRAQLFRYHMIKPDGSRWWTREFSGTYLAPVSMDSAKIQQYLQQVGLLPTTTRNAGEVGDTVE